MFQDYLKQNKLYEHKLRLERNGGWLSKPLFNKTPELSNTTAPEPPKNPAQDQSQPEISSPQPKQKSLSDKFVAREQYDDTFGLNKLIDEQANLSSNVPKSYQDSRSNQAGNWKKGRKNFAQEIGGKPNFTVTINRSDDEDTGSVPREKRSRDGSSEQESNSRKSKRTNKEKVRFTVSK